MVYKKEMVCYPLLPLEMVCYPLLPLEMVCNPLFASRDGVQSLIASIVSAPATTAAAAADADTSARHSEDKLPPPLWVQEDCHLMDLRHEVVLYL